MRTSQIDLQCGCMETYLTRVHYRPGINFSPVGGLNCKTESFLYNLIWKISVHWDGSWPGLLVWSHFSVGFVEAILGPLETFLLVDQHEDEKRETRDYSVFVGWGDCVCTNLLRRVRIANPLVILHLCSSEPLVCWTCLPIAHQKYPMLI